MNEVEKGLKIKDVVIALMLISFSVLATTGILKFKTLYSLLSISPSNIPLGKITTYHEYSALVLIFLILTHLVIQRSWFKRFLKKMMGYKKVVFLTIGVAVSLFIVKLYQDSQNENSTPSIIGTQNLNQLATVEVRQYQGENLSSIKEFRENSIEGPQNVDIETYKLEITGLVNNPTQLSYEEVLEYTPYNKVVTLNCVEGWSATILWEGILIDDLLKEAKIDPEANTIIFHAYDGYTSSLPLDYVIDKNIILAYKMNGVVLPPERGFPFQVVAEDKWGYKWVKWVTKIELSDDPNFKGYWESAGYNMNGDLDGPRFEE